MIHPGLGLSQDLAHQRWVRQVVPFAEIVGLDRDLEPHLRGFGLHRFAQLVSGPAEQVQEAKRSTSRHAPRGSRAHAPHCSRLPSLLSCQRAPGRASCLTCTTNLLHSALLRSAAQPAKRVGVERRRREGVEERERVCAQHAPLACSRPLRAFRAAVARAQADPTLMDAFDLPFAALSRRACGTNALPGIPAEAQIIPSLVLGLQGRRGLVGALALMLALAAGDGPEVLQLLLLGLDLALLSRSLLLSGSLVARGVRALAARLGSRENLLWSPWRASAARRHPSIGWRSDLVFPERGVSNQLVQRRNPRPLGVPELWSCLARRDVRADAKPDPGPFLTPGLLVRQHNQMPGRGVQLDQALHVPLVQL